MKQTNLIINIVLVIAVGALYVLHFMTGTSNESKTNPSDGAKQSGTVQLNGELPIAYVNIDSLLSQMDMYRDLNEELGSKQQKFEANFASDYKSFEKEVNDFQTKVQKGLVTRREAADLETELNNKRVQLENQRNNYLAQLQEENMVSQNRVIDYIMNYLKEHNSANQYQYIFSYSFGGGLLYASDALDITNEVLLGINKKYQAEKSAE